MAMICTTYQSLIQSVILNDQIIYNLPLTGLSHYTPDSLLYPYPYMCRLEGLRACIPTVTPQLPQELQAITTPLDLSKWQSELQGHPDPTYAEFITRGIQYGFRIGFNYSLQNLKPCRKNLRSATKHLSVVDAYLRNEFSKNRLTCIQDPSTLPWFQQTPLVLSPNVTNQENGG